MTDKIIDIFEAIINEMLRWIIGPFVDLATLHTLIYGGDKKLTFGVFNDQQLAIVAHGSAVMQALSAGIILISVILAGMRISSAGINPANRTYALEYFKDFFVVGLLFFNVTTIFQVMFTVNSWFVKSFESAKAATDGNVFEQFTTIMEKGVLGGLILGIILLGLWVWANFYYMMRTLTLMILSIMAPLMVALYLIPQTKGITGGFFKEYAGTVFVQSIHAAVYWIITAVAKDDFGLGSIILYIVFIPVSESIRSLLGLGGQMNDKLSKSAAMMGGAALTGMYSSVKGALDGQSIGQVLKKTAGQVANKANGKGSEENDETKGNSVLAGAGTDIGTTSKAERMLKSGEVTSKGGKAVFGMAGALAGSPMGPMGAMIGASTGFSAGGVIAGVAGRAGMAGSEFTFDRLKAGALAAVGKGKGIKNAEALADEKLAKTLADDDTTKWANSNKEEYMKDLKERFPDASEASVNQMWDKEVAKKGSEFLQKARSTVGQMKKTSDSVAKGSDLVNSTVSSLTNDWAKDNKGQFMKDYDANNPLPANATEGDIQKHNQNKSAAWEKAVDGKRNSIKSIASNTATKLGHGINPNDSFVNKEEFANQVGNEVSSVIGKGARETMTAVKGATDSVKNASLYARKSVNADVLNSQLAGVKTEQMKQGFINNKVASGMSESQAQQAWKADSPGIYQKNIQELSKPQSEGGLPKHIPLDHSIFGNKIARGAVAAFAGTGSGLVAASGVQQVSQFMGDTKLGHFVKASGVGIQQAFSERDPSQNIISHLGDSIATGVQTGWTAGKAHVAQDVVGKQAAFRNAVAMGTGIIGGVRGYKAGASFAAGNTQNTKALGLKGFNPYNNAVNQQVAEISEIQQMAETIMTDKGSEIASGAIRMVTSNAQTVLQVRDKTGNVQTVSRLASGDSSLKNGQTIYQDLAIQGGQFTPSSNVYREDSGGGRITESRVINANPNKIIANRNTPSNPRTVQEVQSYNQMVDSGQYYLRDAMNDMSNIQMVVDRNRSYLVGSKNGTQYRISPYGQGDTRLNTDQVIERSCEVRNNKLIVEEVEGYTSSLKPTDLVPHRSPNKRTLARKQNELLRNKSLTETLRW